MKPHRVLLPVCLVLATAGTAWCQPVGDLMLEDSEGRQVAVAPANFCWILASDREGSRFSRRWLTELRSVKPRPELIEVAHLASVPWVARPFVRRAFRHSPAVLLDWQGELERRYGFDPEQVNVYLLDSQRRLLLKASGREPDQQLNVFLSRSREMVAERAAP